MFNTPYETADALGKTVNDYARIVSEIKGVNDDSFNAYVRNGMLPDKYNPNRRPERLHGHFLNMFVTDMASGRREINKIGLNFLQDNLPGYIASGRAPVGLHIHDASGAGLNYLTYTNIAVQTQIESIFYSKYRVPSWFPMKTDIPEGSEAYQYSKIDTFGEARFVENYGTNASSAGVSMGENTYPLRRGAIDMKWADRDLQQATLQGIPLKSKLTEASTLGCKKHMELVALGTAQDGFENGGLLNHTDISISTEATPWNALPDTADVISRIGQRIAQIIEDTNEIFGGVIDGPLAIYGTTALRQFLNTQITLNGVGTGQSIWEYIRYNNVWSQETGNPLTYIQVKEMGTAGVGDTQRILFGYPTSDEVWEMGASISVPRIQRIVTEVYGYRSGMIYEISGLNVKRNGGLLYVDNVFDPELENFSMILNNNGDNIDANDGNLLADNVNVS
jgi:hypothetical protein